MISTRLSLWVLTYPCVYTNKCVFLKRTHYFLYSLTLSEPHKPQAMSEMHHALCLLQSYVHRERKASMAY